MECVMLSPECWFSWEKIPAAVRDNVHMGRHVSHVCVLSEDRARTHFSKGEYVTVRCEWPIHQPAVQLNCQRNEGEGTKWRQMIGGGVDRLIRHIHKSVVRTVPVLTPCHVMLCKQIYAFRH